MRNIVRVYRQTEGAHAAYQSLLDQGFRAEDIELLAQGDEAGAIKGNFIAGNQGGADFTGNEVGDYGGNFDNVEFGPVYLLSVATTSDQQYRLAEEILGRFGGLEPDSAKPH